MSIYIQFFIICYFILYIIINKLSAGYGIIMFWISLFIIPYPILSFSFISFFQFTTIEIIISSFSFWCNSTYRKEISSFCKKKKKLIIVLLTVYLSLIIFSETVPYKDQLYNLFNELLTFLIITETFIFTSYSKQNKTKLLKAVTYSLLINIVYSFICEAYLQINFAGGPLYILLGMDSNEYLIDMIESARGVFSFRMQSTFGHPLSLGQYFLVLVPIYFCSLSGIGNKTRITTLILLVISIFLSGTRGAIFPLLVIAIIFLIRVSKIKLLKYSLLSFCFLTITYTLLPIKKQMFINQQISNFSTYIQFWDDKKQNKSNVGGSSVSMRLEQFEAATNEIRNNPLFGKGRTYREYYQNQHAQMHPKLLGFESFILLKLVEQGWIGLIFFIIIIFTLYKIFKKKTHNITILKLIFIAYILSTLITGIRPYTFLLLGLTASILVTNSKKIRNENIIYPTYC